MSPCRPSTKKFESHHATLLDLYGFVGENRKKLERS